MNLTPILTASTAIQMHIATIIIALIATGVILTMRKGTRIHRYTGWVWAVSMMVTSVITFWIDSFDLAYGFSPIHIFSVVVLVNVPYAIISIRRGNVEAHKNAMLSVTVGALGIAGLFTFMPGRIMWEVFF